MLFWHHLLSFTCIRDQFQFRELYDHCILAEFGSINELKVDINLPAWLRLSDFYIFQDGKTYFYKFKWYHTHTHTHTFRQEFKLYIRYLKVMAIIIYQFVKYNRLLKRKIEVLAYCDQRLLSKYLNLEWYVSTYGHTVVSTITCFCCKYIMELPYV